MINLHIQQYFPKADVIFFVYDITNEEDFDSDLMNDWIEAAKEKVPDSLFYLIGSKSDLEDKRVVTFNRAIQFAKEKGFHKCFETSSLTG